MEDVSASLNEIKDVYGNDVEDQSSFSTSVDQSDIEMEGSNIISIQLLSCHQNKVLEEASEVLPQGFAAGDGALDREFVQDLEGNASALDGTNVCSFLTMKIIDTNRCKFIMETAS